MTRISVIIPVYNVEPYLDECLDSLAKQDFTDFEAICVNDGSTDGSRALLDQWAARVSWLRIVDKSNGGVSSARNAGLDAAKGAYVCFLDGDDRFSPHALSTMVRAFDESGADLLSYGGVAFPDGAADAWTSKALLSRDAQWDDFDVKNVFFECQRTLILIALSRRLVDQGLRFDEHLTLGEDLMMRFAACARARRVRTISDSLYEYRVQRGGSAVTEAKHDVSAHRYENLSVVHAIVNDYDAVGVLDACYGQIVSLLGRYVLVDALKMNASDGDELMKRSAEMLASIRDKRIWRDACQTSSEREVLDACFSGTRLSTFQRRVLLARLVKCYYGRLAALRTFVGRA